jgi:hypothetical protein
MTEKVAFAGMEQLWLGREMTEKVLLLCVILLWRAALNNRRNDSC